MRTRVKAVAGRRWAAVLAVASGILVLSLVPMPSGDPGVAVGPADKVAHAVGYAVLGVAGIRATAFDPRLGRRGTRPAAGVSPAVGAVGLAVGVILAVAAFGGGVELLQIAVPGREFEGVDALANAAGATVGVGWWTGHRRSPVRERARSDAGR